MVMYKKKCPALTSQALTTKRSFSALCRNMVDLTVNMLPKAAVDLTVNMLKLGCEGIINLTWYSIYLMFGDELRGLADVET